MYASCKTLVRHMAKSIYNILTEHAYFIYLPRLVAPYLTHCESHANSCDRQPYCLQPNVLSAHVLPATSGKIISVACLTLGSGWQPKHGGHAFTEGSEITTKSFKFE